MVDAFLVKAERRVDIERFFGKTRSLGFGLGGAGKGYVGAGIGGGLDLSAYSQKTRSKRHPSRFFLGVNPNFLTKVSTILRLLPGVSGTGIGGISTSISILSVSSLFPALPLFLLFVDADSLDFLDCWNNLLSLSPILPSVEKLHLDS